jgi:hypothetical protein
MTNLAVYQPQNLQDAQALAKLWSCAGLVPAAFRGKPSDILLVMARGSDMGLSPVQSLHAFFVINGRVGMYSDALVGVVVGKPMCRYFRLVSSDDKQATYETLREGSPEPVRLTYTMEQAKAAGLTSNATYSKHPAAMLRARCSAALARATYPDLVAGIYEPSELEEIPQAALRQSDRVNAGVMPEAPPVDVVTVEPVTGEIWDEHQPEVTDETEPDPEPVEDVRVTFGKHNGKLIRDLTSQQLGGFIKLANETLKNPEKARFHSEQEQWLAHLLAEEARRATQA